MTSSRDARGIGKESKSKIARAAFVARPRAEKLTDMQSENYHVGLSKSILPFAARELLDLAQLEFLADARSPKGVSFGQLALLLLRIAGGVPLPHADEPFRFFPSSKNFSRRPR